MGTDTKGAPEASRSLPRHRFFDDMPDKGLFALVALGGFAAVIWLKVRRHDPETVAIVAVCFMVVYGLIAYNIPAVRFRLDRLGDNFYYLGFIYTLASMAAALIQLRESIQIEPILGSFGIALITTIVGVAGRVMLVQMRSEIDDVEEQTRRDLLNASKDLRAQLALALREFETFATAMRQTAEESTRQSAAAAQQQIELIAAVAQRASSEIKAAFEANRPSSQELHAVLEQLTSLLESTGTVRRRRWYWPFKRRERIAPRWPRRRWYWPFQR
jgi:hypothetical protein